MASLLIRHTENCNLPFKLSCLKRDFTWRGSDGEVVWDSVVWDSVVWDSVVWDSVVWDSVV